MHNKKLDKYIKAFLNGDSKAFDVIYEETKVVVYYTILGVLKDESLSEDIMQDTYVKMIQKLNDYQFNHGFRAWIKTIAKNLAINEYNKRSKSQLVDVDEADYLLTEMPTDHENRYYLQQLLNTLPDDEKEIVIRHVIHDQTHKMIAQGMKMPLGTVLWKYQKALKTLKRKDGAT